MNINIELPTKEFLEKFRIEIKAEEDNKEIVEKFRKILEKTEKIIIKNDLPEFIMGIFTKIHDKELGEMISKINDSILESLVNFLYKEVLELELNRYIIILSEKCEIKHNGNNYFNRGETKNTLELFEILEKYSNDYIINIVFSYGYVMIYLLTKLSKRLIFAISIGRFNTAYDSFIFELKANILQDKLKEYIKALLI